MKIIKTTFINSAVAFFFLFFLHETSIGNGQQGISYNEQGLAIVAGFGKRQAGNESKIKKLKLMLQINAP